MLPHAVRNGHQFAVSFSGLWSLTLTADSVYPIDPFTQEFVVCSYLS